MNYIIYASAENQWINTDTQEFQHLATWTSDLEDIKKASAEFKKIIIDSTQSSALRKNPGLITEYLKLADSVIVINNETPHNFDELVEYYDLPGVVFLTTGTLNCDVKHMKVVQYENFLKDLQDLYRQLPTNYFDQIDYQSPKPFYFDALLGYERPHRLAVKEHLEKYHKDRCILTCYGNRLNSIKVSDIDGSKYLWPHDVDIDQIPPDTDLFAALMVRYYRILINICYIIPIEVYNQTAYSVVTETCTNNSFVFVTEKTIKPMLARRLFVVFAGQYHLRHLKNLGFQTFENIIDESYDLIEDPHKRWAAAAQQIDRLCAMDQQTVLDAVQSAVEHNFKLVMNTNWKQLYRQQLQQAIFC
jgi:hypothetical protein